MLFEICLVFVSYFFYQRANKFMYMYENVTAYFFHQVKVAAIVPMSQIKVLFNWTKNFNFGHWLVLISHRRNARQIKTTFTTSYWKVPAYQNSSETARVQWRAQIAAFFARQRLNYKVNKAIIFLCELCSSYDSKQVYQK